MYKLYMYIQYSTDIHIHITKQKNQWWMTKTIKNIYLIINYVFHFISFHFNFFLFNKKKKSAKKLKIIWKKKKKSLLYIDIWIYFKLSSPSPSPIFHLTSKDIPLFFFFPTLFLSLTLRKSKAASARWRDFWKKGKRTKGEEEEEKWKLDYICPTPTTLSPPPPF